MGIRADLDAASVLETVLNGKQAVGPVLDELASFVADLKLALGHAEKAIAGLQAINAEIQAARPAANNPPS